MSSSVSWGLKIEPGVFHAAHKLPQGDARRIRDAIRLLPLNPYAGDIEKINGVENVWRRRVGAYRIFYKLLSREKLILVFHLERRTSTTY